MKKTTKPLVDFTSNFNAQRKAAPLEIKVEFRDVFEIFLVDPQNDALGNHSLDKLGKRFFGMRSIDVADDWRALYRKKGDQTNCKGKTISYQSYSHHSKKSLLLKKDLLN